MYDDGSTLYSGGRTGHMDINRLALGYVGHGPGWAREFLSAAGYDLTADEIASIKPGDSISLRQGRAHILRKET